MYRLLFTLAALAATLTATAQISSGTIDYREHTEFDFGDWMDAERKKEMMKQMSEGAWDMTGRLSFEGDVYSYQQLPPDASKSAQGNGWMMRMAENPEVFYTNMADSVQTDRRRVMDRMFVVEGDWEVPQWNIANMKVGMKELPLPNQLATAITATGDTLTAYFTESIPMSIGPKGYGGLPGAIVYLKVQNEGRFTEYTMVTMQPGAAVEMKKPDQEKVIDREEYEKQVARGKEMMERRRRNWDRQRGN